MFRNNTCWNERQQDVDDKERETSTVQLMSSVSEGEREIVVTREEGVG